MKITKVKKTDKAEIKKLWADAFSEQEPFLSWYFDNFWKSENSLCTKNDTGELMGALTLIPYDVVFNARKYSASYIAGVSVYEKFRNRGIAKNLMRAALSEQRKRGELLSLLIPFNYDFYRKMGYEVCYMRTVKKLDKCKDEERKNIVPLSIENYTEMNDLYNEFCINKNGYILRSVHSWEYILNRISELKTYAIGYKENEKLLSYCVYTKEKEKMVIHEIVGESSGVEKLKSHILSLDNNVFSVMPDIGDEISEKEPTVMARITDAGKAFGEFDECNIKIKITDDFIEENNGIFSFGSIEKIEYAKYDAEMDIKYFTQYFCGFVSCAELLKNGKITISEENCLKLDSIRQKKDNYINLIMSEDF